MSLRFPSAQLADLRDSACQLIETADDHERQLELFVAAAERERTHAEAVSRTTGAVDVDEVRRLLAAQLQRTAAGAAAARGFLLAAHQQHAAARRLLAHLDACHGTDLCRNAVLIVDDYGDIRDVLARVLEGAGYTVRTAADGLEALIAAHEMRPGVIVMDVSMPVLDGIEATRLIKAREATRNARVIAYTADPSFDDSPIRPLFAAVLAKPATPGTVLAMVQQVAGL